MIILRFTFVLEMVVWLFDVLLMLLCVNCLWVVAFGMCWLVGWFVMLCLCFV